MFRVIFALVLLIGGGPVFAQSQPLKGVVWTPPADLREAQADLTRMVDAGVEAVRTTLITDEALLTHADTLGLQFFQELPIRYLTASALLDSLETAQLLLAGALQRAQQHTSARHFGLAAYSDTSRPSACTYFEMLTQQARAVPHVSTYYIPFFIEADVCVGQVDFVLLATNSVTTPRAALHRWHQVHAGRPAGVAALGMWTIGERAMGTQQPHSPQAQARYLENHLNQLLADTSQAVAVFVDRWRDSSHETPVTYTRRVHMERYRTGLHDAEGTPRLAFGVMRGIYRGERTVFAFATGAPPRPTASWRLLVGWGIITLLVLGYAGLPRFQRMVQRYFTSHGFFRDAVRDARETVLDLDILLLVLQALGIGLVGMFIVDVARMEPAFEVLMAWMPEELQRVAGSLVAQPGVTLLLIAGLYALMVALWSSVLGMVSQRQYGGLSWPQVLTLVVWARWPFFLLMMASLVAETVTPEQQRLGAVVLFGAGGILFLVASLRATRDYLALTRLSKGWAVVLVLAHPTLWLAIAGGVVWLNTLAEVAFVWRALTLT